VQLVLRPRDYYFDLSISCGLKIPTTDASLWNIGRSHGEAIALVKKRDNLHVEMGALVFQVIQDRGPTLYHNDSEEQERSFAAFASTRSKFSQIPGRPPEAGINQEAVEITTYPLISSEEAKKEMWPQRRSGRTLCRKSSVLAYFPVKS
jgi:hypothetical protein